VPGPCRTLTRALIASPAWRSVASMANPFGFTKENAAEMARRGAVTRRRKYQERKLREERDRQRAAQVLADNDPTADYITIRIGRIRAQLDRLDEMLLLESDPQKLSWLATCTAKLAEQERVLSGRPQPGQLRPAAPRRRNGDHSPVIPE
jgi:hypothetical protein